jgi:deoxyribonuclease-1
MMTTKVVNTDPDNRIAKMHLALLFLVALLAGCQAFLSPPKQTTEGAPSTQEQASQIPNQRSAMGALEIPIELVSGTTATGHRDYEAAKKVLPIVFLGIEKDFFCGCRYTGKLVNLASCEYRPRNSMKARIEWAHVVPVWALGRQRQCWRQGGRKRCAAKDALFMAAEGDLVNLVPAVGVANGDRRNSAVGPGAQQPKPIDWSCRTVDDRTSTRLQPREEVRGRAARITLYMHRTYSIPLSQQDKNLMCMWAKTYPVDDWERQRNERVAHWQGTGNPLVTDPSLLAEACN